MNSIAFPNMLSSTKVNIVEGLDATIQNLSLLLQSPKFSLIGDPYFGTQFANHLFEFNGQPLFEEIRDEIYHSIIIFMPQLKLTRDDITFRGDKTTLLVTIAAKNYTKFELDLTNLLLTRDRG